MPLTIAQYQKLELHDWAVFTDDTITQNAIALRLADLCSDSDSKTTIFYDGKEIPVFKVSFSVVKFLAKNRHTVPYDFTAYHKETKRVPWAMWKEGKSTPNERLRKLSYLFQKSDAVTLKEITSGQPKKGKEPQMKLFR
jgi:hypothetical protein